MNLELGVLSFLVGLFVIAIIAKRQIKITKIIIFGYLARAAFVFIDDLVLGISRGGDGYWWSYWADVWARRGITEILTHLDTGHDLYKVFIALNYYQFGRSEQMIQMINAFCGTLVIIFAWKLTIVLGAQESSSKRAAWLVALFPSCILHSGVLLREVAVTLPLIMGVYYLSLWFKHRHTIYAVYASIALLISMAFHSGGFAVILALAAWVFGSWIKSFLTGKLRLFVRNTLALVLVAGAVAFTSGTGWGMEKFSKLETEDMDTVSQTQKHFSKGRAAYLVDLQADTPGELAFQSPLRLIYFLFAPFPWMVSGLRDVIGFADAIFFLLLVWFLLRGRKALRQNSTALLVIALFAAMAFTFALGVSNYGTAFRHRSKMLPMLIAVAMSVPRKNRRNGIYQPIQMNPIYRKPNVDSLMLV